MRHRVTPLPRGDILRLAPRSTQETGELLAERKLSCHFHCFKYRAPSRPAHQAVTRFGRCPRPPGPLPGCRLHTHSVCPRQKDSMQCGAAAQLTRIFSSRSAVSTKRSSGVRACERGDRKSSVAPLLPECPGKGAAARSWPRQAGAAPALPAPAVRPLGLTGWLPTAAQLGTRATLGTREPCSYPTPPGWVCKSRRDVSRARHKQE